MGSRLRPWVYTTLPKIICEPNTRLGIGLYQPHVHSGSSLQFHLVHLCPILRIANLPRTEVT